MATVGFLKTNPSPTRSELAHGISGNLCRCQDYDKILTAHDERRRETMRKVNHAWSGESQGRSCESTEHIQAHRQELPHARPLREGHRQGEVCRGLPCRRHAVLQAAAQPVPHGRVKHIDTSEALAMPGVKAILTADDLPAPADSVTDNGAVIKANKRGERALTMEPLYQGEPILAVAAVDELTAAEAIEKIDIDFEHLPFVVDPLDSLRPGGPNPRTRRQHLGAAGASQAGRAASPPPTGGAQVDRGGLRRGEDRAACPWARRPTSGPTAMSMRVSRTPRWSSMKPSSRRTPAIRRSRRAPRWLIGRTARSIVHTGTQSTVQTLAGLGRWLNMDPKQSRPHQRIHRRRIWQQDHRRHLRDHSGAPVEESQCAGDDAHQPRRRDISSDARGPVSRAG